MYRALVILGAPRSGTNALRDSICRLPGFITWPCDELNYLWKYTNSRYIYDDLNLSHFNPKVSSRINSLFQNLSSKTDSVVVEKTCANCLRVPFIHSIIPHAKFLYIRRDPYDVLASSLKRWKAPLDIPYILKKALYIPKSEFPYYALRYAFHRFKRHFSSEAALPSWGPRFPGIDECRSALTLEELCLLQWYQCCYAAETSLLNLKNSGSSVYFLGYRDFVSSPEASICDLLSSLGFSFSSDQVKSSASYVYSSSVGKGSSSLSDSTRSLVRNFLSSRDPLPLSSLF